METSTSPENVSLNKYGYNAIARHTFTAIFTCLPLFLAAGTFSWNWAWVYSAATLIGWLALSAVLVIENPGLLNDRGKRTKDMLGTKRWDWIILSIYSLLLFLTPIVAGLDYRNGWSDQSAASGVVNIIGILMQLLSFVPLTWAMAVNKSFQAMVQIKTDGAQPVTATGPYRLVRHPGYMGVILQFIALPLALTTWAAGIPALLGIVLFIIRTKLEDDALRSELPGYVEFAERTRYRLLPGLW
ncbi:MAG: isoprenylcysteine carboxylmethyltransferase family protein [Anaerolineae bacterium]